MKKYSNSSCSFTQQTFSMNKTGKFLPSSDLSSLRRDRQQRGNKQTRWLQIMFNFCERCDWGMQVRISRGLLGTGGQGSGLSEDTGVVLRHAGHEQIALRRTLGKGWWAEGTSSAKALWQEGADSLSSANRKKGTPTGAQAGERRERGRREEEERRQERALRGELANIRFMA